MQVHGFVRAAGFDREAGRTATAVALATSDGADHYQWHSDDTPGVDQRGLFGLDVARIGQDDAHTLYDPNVNAQLAYALWSHYGKTWHWHPAWATNKGLSVRAVLMALDEDKGWVSRPAHMHGILSGIAKPWDMDRVTKYLTINPEATAPESQGELWPTPTP